MTLEFVNMFYRLHLCNYVCVCKRTYISQHVDNENFEDNIFFASFMFLYILTYLQHAL